MIIDELKKLKSEFEVISKKGYIKGITNSSSAIGNTFENELHLPENEFCIPDYYGIEIKTRRTYSKSWITLFNAIPDGESFFEVERLKDTYGYPCKKDRNYKVFYAEIFGNVSKFAGVKYKYKLEIDRENMKVFLCVYNRFDYLIEKKVFWSFNYLNERLFSKLRYLAVVNAWVNEINGWNYFKYYKINFYKLTNFNNFIDMIENGDIKIVMRVDIHTGINNYGKTYNHGCGFCVSEKNIDKLFKRIVV